jgi:cell division protein FtsW
MEAVLKRTSGDKAIWGVVLLLALASLLIIYSATGTLAFKMREGHTEYYLFKQAIIFAIGFGITWFAHKWNYTTYSKLAVLGYLISIPLLLVTLFLGAKLNGGSRWLPIPGTGLTFQTSDFAKLALFIFIARQLSRYQSQIHDRKIVLHKLFLPAAVIIVLILPANFSTAAMVSLICGILFFIGRVKILHLVQLGGVAIISALLLIYLMSLTGIGRTKTWASRIESFAGVKNEDPEKEKEKNFQIEQAKIAIANGGLLGRGPGKSMQKNFLPHPYSDMVFPIIIEEYGLLGAGLVIFLYLFFLWRSILIFRRCPYAFGAFLALGLSFTLVIQAMFNMCVGVGIFPVTGLTLPMISMGGTSVWFTSLSIGIILSVSKFVEESEGKNKTINKVGSNTVNE